MNCALGGYWGVAISGVARGSTGGGALQSPLVPLWAAAWMDDTVGVARGCAGAVVAAGTPPERQRCDTRSNSSLQSEWLGWGQGIPRPGPPAGVVLVPRQGVDGVCWMVGTGSVDDRTWVFSGVNSVTSPSYTSLYSLIRRPVGQPNGHMHRGSTPEDGRRRTTQDSKMKKNSK